nr:hypothetical protein [Yersinia massiliensis]
MRLIDTQFHLSADIGWHLAGSAFQYTVSVDRPKASNHMINKWLLAFLFIKTVKK